MWYLEYQVHLCLLKATDIWTIIEFLLESSIITDKRYTKDIKALTKDRP